MLVEQNPVIGEPAAIRIEATQLLHATCARLMTYASRSGAGAGALVPELAAAAPTVSAGGRVYTFRIRPGYRFSRPSGRPVTAAAFERAIERGANTGLLDDVAGAAAYAAGRARRVAGVSARGDRLTIRLTRPSPRLPATLATFFVCAVPPNTPTRPRRLERVATAGPYYVAAVAPRNRLVLRRNPGYPGPRPQRFETIEVTIGTTPQRAVAEVEAGRADYTAGVRRDSQPRLLARYGPDSRAAAAGRQRFFTGRDPALSGFALNPHRPLFARPAMRRAVGYAIDRRALAQSPLPGSFASRPTDQLIPPGWPGFRDATVYPLGAPDVAAARRLAGGGRRRGVLYTCNADECIEVAEIARANLKAIGIDLDIRRFASGEMFARITDPDLDEPFDISVWGWIGDTPDPSEFVDAMFGYYRTSAGFLAGTRLGKRLRAAGRLTGAARIEAYARLDRDLVAQAAPVVPAASATRTDFFSARIGCQVEHPLYGIELGALCLRG